MSTYSNVAAITQWHTELKDVLIILSWLISIKAKKNIYSGINGDIYALACIERTCLDVHMWTNIHMSIHNGLWKWLLTFDLSPYWHMACSACQKRREGKKAWAESLRKKNRLIMMKKKNYARDERVDVKVTSGTDWFMGDLAEMRLNSEWQIADTGTIYN